MRFAAPVLAALFLSGCATSPGQESDPGEYEWIATEAEGLAGLAFAIPETDAVTIQLSCAPGGGTVTVAGYFAEPWPGARPLGRQDSIFYTDRSGREQPWPTRLAVRAGGVRTSHAGTATVDEMSGGVEARAVIPASAESLRAWASRGGDLLVFHRGELTGGVAAPPTTVQRFLSKCAGRS